MSTRKKPPVPKWYISIILIAAGVLLNTIVLVFTVPYILFYKAYTKGFSAYLQNVSHLGTQAGNTIHADFLNRFFWKKGGAESGDTDESISSVTGKNYERGMLTKAGHVLWWVLEKIDPNHCVDAIEDDEGN